MIIICITKLKSSYRHKATRVSLVCLHPFPAEAEKTKNSPRSLLGGGETSFISEIQAITNQSGILKSERGK